MNRGQKTYAGRYRSERMASELSATPLGPTAALREGGVIAGILFVWFLFAGVCVLVADLAPATAVLLGTALESLALLFCVVGIANTLLYVIVRGISLAE